MCRWVVAKNRSRSCCDPGADLPVHGNGAQIENGRSRAHDIKGDPDVAELFAKDPETLQVVGHGKHHDKASDKQVGYGQRNDEQIAHFPQRAIRVDGDAHQDVAGDRQEDDDGQENTCRPPNVTFH